MKTLTKNKKKWHKKWWGVLIIIVIIILIVIALASAMYIAKVVHNLNNQVADYTDSYEGEIKALIEGPGYISLGAGDPTITIVEFADFNCPFCKESVDIGRQLVDEYEGVKLIHRDFPLSGASLTRSLAARCAQEQGKFWPMYDQLFKYQDKNEVTDLIRLAQDVNINGALFKDCLESQKYLNQVQKDWQDGEELDIVGTPTWFVNGYRISGYLPLEGMEGLIQKLLEYYEGN